MDLSSNRISVAGIAALASALRGGAMPLCARILLDRNRGSKAPVQKALASPERAAALDWRDRGRRGHANLLCIS